MVCPSVMSGIATKIKNANSIINNLQKSADTLFLQKAFFSNLQKNSNPFLATRDPLLPDALVGQNIPSKPLSLEKKSILCENDPAFAHVFDHDNADNKLALNGSGPTENEPKGADEYTLNVGRGTLNCLINCSHFY